MNKEIFSRFISLVGEENFNKLKNKKILVFGLGGVGGFLVDSLLRCGISNFTLIDPDKYSLSSTLYKLVI